LAYSIDSASTETANVTAIIRRLSVTVKERLK